MLLTKPTEYYIYRGTGADQAVVKNLKHSSSCTISISLEYDLWVLNVTVYSLHLSHYSEVTRRLSSTGRKCLRRQSLASRTCWIIKFPLIMHFQTIQSEHIRIILLISTKVQEKWTFKYKHIHASTQNLSLPSFHCPQTTHIVTETLTSEYKDGFLSHSTLKSHF